MKSFEDLNITDYFKIIRRRIWYVVVVAVLVSAIGVLYVRRLPNLYKSETTIMLSNRLVPEDYIGSLVRETATDRIDFVRQQLRSRSFIEGIIQEFRLGNPNQANTDLVNGIIFSVEISVMSPSTIKLAYTAGRPDQAQAIV